MQNEHFRVKRPIQHNGQSGNHNSFLLFKTSLFASDCMIMFIYAAVKVGNLLYVKLETPLFQALWLLQFEWKYGSLWCKMYRYWSSVAFFSNSNIVCGIALDRYLSVYSNHIIGKYFELELDFFEREFNLKYFSQFNILEIESFTEELNQKHIKYK